MDHYKVEKVTKAEKTFVKTTCDVKGCTNTSGRHGHWGPEASRSQYVVNEVIISHRNGEQYPEGSFIKQFKPDICAECFEKHVVPMLVALGIEPKYEDASW